MQILINLKQQQKMEILKEKKQVFVLTFVDEEQVNKINRKKQIILPQMIKDNVSIDFSSMLERQWSVEAEEVIFDTKTKIKVQKNKQIEEVIKNFNNQAQHSGLIAHRIRNKNDKKSKLLDIETIVKSPQNQEDIDLFLDSSWFQICIRFFVILYIIGLILTDYSFRLETETKKHIQNSTQNIISLHLQLLANCAFTLQIFLKMNSKNKFLQNPWNILNLVGCISCWGSIYLQYEIYDGKPMFHILSILKILLGVRLIQIFQFIKNPFQSFISSLPELAKIFFPYFIFIILYAVLGLILFQGANQYRCRETPAPVNKVWPQISSNLCGSMAFTCSSGHCGNPYDYQMSYNQTQIRQIKNQFGLASFDNIGKSILTIYHYVFLSNWTNIKYKYSKFIHPYIATFYFFTLALFLFFIMSNLNMITISKSFIELQKQKQKKKVKQPNIEQQNQQNLQSHMTTSQLFIYNILQYIDILLVGINSVVILIQYEGMPKSLKISMNQLDFVLTMLCLVVILLKSILLRKKIFDDKFIILDWITVMLSIIDIFNCLRIGVDVINPQQNQSIILRSFKFVRVIKILYFSQTMFTFEKKILKIFLQTLNTIKSFILLLLCVLMILAFIGQNLFAYKAKFDPITRLVNLQHGDIYVVNFNSLYKAMVAVTYLLENERWTETMYYYYEAVGWIAIAYFTVVVFIIHLLLTRLFIAIFLCYFRRNLQKKSQHLENDQKSNPSVSSSNCVAEFLEDKTQKVQNKQQNNVEQANRDKKLFLFFNRNTYAFQMFRACHNSSIFDKIVTLFKIIQCLLIILRTNHDNEEKTLILDILQAIVLYFFVVQTMMGILGFGLYFDEEAYLKRSKMNYINIIVMLLVIISEIRLLGIMEMRLIRRFTILKVLTFFTKTSKQTSIVLSSISAIALRFIRMILMYIFLLTISCIFPLKLGQQKLYSCENYPGVIGSHSNLNYRQCMLMGGDWIRDAQSFSNIFQSLVLMYQVVTSQSWTYFIQRFKQDPWDFFFVLNFFICNTCLLNIFVGLTVETYLSLKDEAYKLNLLRPSQRMWVLIRNSINQLIPVPKMKAPDPKHKFRNFAYSIISQPVYQNFIDILAYINLFTYTLKYYRAEESFLHDLNIINIIILVIFMIDTIFKLQLHWNFFYLDNSRIELAGFIYHILYAIIIVSFSVNLQFQRALKFLSALVLILRCKKHLFRFTWCKTLLNSVLEILPKCVIIGALLAVILFFYVSIGMQIFKYTKPTPKSDGYTTGFNNAFTSLITLLKIVSNESWFQQVSAFVRNSTPIDICFTIDSIEMAEKYPYMGCGVKSGYVYLISFHMIIALLVLNLLIATMVAAYDQNYEKQYKSVNIFQLQDCLKLWQKYDPDGTGIIPYKKFWRLSSQIAILFGISKKKLIKSKQKFLQQLDIDICQSVDPNSSPVLCYKFHDVLTKFSKVKLKVSKNDNEQGNDFLDFQIHPMIQRQIKDYVTEAPPLYEQIESFKNLKSGEMRYFLGLLRKLRAWRIVAKKKDSSVISKLSHIIQMALEKKQKQQKKIKKIRISMSNFMSQSID